MKSIDEHGPASDWEYQGTKEEDSTGQGFVQGDTKVYEVYTDTNGDQIEYHYHVLKDGHETEHKIKFPVRQT
jgi:hypothetical protein